MLKHMHTERRGRCPNHPSGDPKGHLYQNEDSGQWYCFKCGKGGGSGTLPEGVKWITSREVLAEKRLPKDRRKADWYERLEANKHPAAMEYLENHRVRYDVARKFEVGVADNSLILPVFGADGRISMYQTRWLGEKKEFRIYGPRSFHLPLFETFLAPKTWHDDTGQVTMPASGLIVIVESMVSALRLNPFVPAAATMGKTVSMAQVLRLRLLANQCRLAIWFDSDAHGKAWELRRELDGTRKAVKVIMLEGDVKGTDPCDVEDLVVIRAIQGAMR